MSASMMGGDGGGGEGGGEGGGGEGEKAGKVAVSSYCIATG